MRIYLAGPDVFHPYALRLGEAKKTICADFGLTGVFPLDETASAEGIAPRDHGLAIAAKDLRLARSCDAAIVNLTPFRGASMDVGSAVELGLIAGGGCPVWGYTNTARDFAGRVGDITHVTRSHDGQLRSADGMAVEDFGLIDNLMIEGTIRDSGGKVFRPDSMTLPFEDLSLFSAAVRDLAETAKPKVY